MNSLSNYTQCILGNFQYGGVHKSNFLRWLMSTLEEYELIMLICNRNDNYNDNDNILFNHNIQIEIIIYNSLENQIIDWSGDYY